MSELIRRLDRRRIDLHVACFRREGAWLAAVEDAGLPVTEFRLGSLQSPRALRQLLAFARWCRSNRLQVLQTCDIYGNIVGLTGAALARVPVRIGSRRGIVSPTGRRSLLTLQRFGYRAAHRVVANSEAAAAQLASEGVPRSAITVIPNGLDFAPFEVPRSAPADPIVTTVANLRPGKGHDVLLHAAARVLKSQPRTQFHLVGDGTLREALEQQAARLGIRDAVQFLGQRSDVARILRSSTIFAFPSLMEAFPNGVMEAMAAELPVVATCVGGIPELVEHERSGLLVPPGDDRSLAEAITRLLEHRGDAATFATAGRRVVEERYSFDRMVTDFESLYRGLVN